MANLFLDGHKLHHHPERIAQWMKGEEIVPVHTEISPTNNCNQRCSFCYVAYSGYKRGTLKRDTFLKLMEDMGAMGVKSCLLAGDGEPLINKATPDAIVTGALAGVDMALNTNGTLLTEEITRKIIPHLTWLRFSVMGGTAETYAKVHDDKPETFEKVWTAIERCVAVKHETKAKVTIGVQLVLIPENAPEIYDLTARCKRTGVDYFVVKPFSQHPLNDYKPEDAAHLHVTYRELLLKAQALTDENFTMIMRWETFSDKGERTYDRCLGLPFISQISSDGGVYTCCPFYGEEPHLYGSLYEKSYPEIWASARKKEVMKRVEETVNVHTCMTFCRHHQINKYLWKLRYPPEHVNFI